MFAAAGRYMGATWRRILIRNLARGVALAGTKGIGGKMTTNPLEGFDGLVFDEWIAGAFEAINAEPGYAMLIWPPQRNRGRVYAHLLDRKGTPLGFAKISANAKNDAEFRNEASALRAVGRLHVDSFGHPSCLHEGVLGGCLTLIFDPLPVGARNGRVDPRPLIPEYRGEIRRIDCNGDQAPRWRDLVRTRAAADGSSAFLDSFEACLGSPAEVCFVHGDLIRSNVLIHNGRPWIVDWELSAPDGPVLVDEMTHWMSLHMGKQVSDPKIGVEMFKAQFITDQSPEAVQRATLAFGYRYAMGIGFVVAMAQVWNHGG